MRRILCTISILIASLGPITAAEDPFTSVMARRDAGLLGTPTNLFRTNLLAGTNLFLEYLSGGRLRFNVTVTPGTGTNTLFQIQGVNIGSAGTENWVNGVTGFVSGATVVLGVSINTNVFQPASSNLTNWAQIPTNILSSLTNFITAVQSNYFEVVGGQLNLTNFNLTNWSNLPTNVIPALVFTNDGTNIRVVNKELNRFLTLNPTNTTGAGSGLAITNKIPRISLYETNGGNQWDWTVTGLGANRYRRAIPNDNYSLTMNTNGQIDIIGVRLPTSTILLSLNTNDDPVFSFPPVFMIDQGGDIVMLNRVRMNFPTTNGLADGTLQGWASTNGTNFFWTSFLFQPANTNLSNWANLPTNVIGAGIVPPWTNDSTFTFLVSNTNAIHVSSADGSLTLGTNSASYWGGFAAPGNSTIISVRNVGRGEAAFNEGVFYVIANDAGTNEAHFSFGMSLQTASDIVSVMTNGSGWGIERNIDLSQGAPIVQFKIREEATNYVNLWPTVANGVDSVAFLFDTTNPLLTSTNAIAFRTKGTNRLAIAGDAVFPNDPTKFFNGSGRWSTPSGGSGTLAVQTNSANLGTETNFNLISGLGIQFRGTNVSGTNQLQILVDSNLTNWVNISTNVLTGLGLTTNANQFLGAPLSIKDGASVTNLTNYSVFTVASNGIIIFGPNTTNALSATGQIMTWTNGGPSADFHIVNKNGKFAALQITEGNHAMILADVGGDVYFGPNNNGSGTILITPSTMIPVVSNTVHLGEVVRPYIDLYLSHALVLSNNNIYSLAAGANTTFTTNGSILTIASAGGAGGNLTTNENQFAGAPLSIKNGAVVTNLTNFGVFTFAVDPLGKKYQVTTANDLASLFFQGGQSSFNVHSNGMFSHAISTVDTNVGFLVYFGGDGQHIFEVQTNGLVRLTSDAGKQYDFSPSDTGLSIYHVGQPTSFNLDTNGLVSIAAATINTNVAFELYNANDGVVYFGIRTNLPGSGNYLAVDPNNLLMRTNAGSGTPGGGSGAVQFNESGAFAGTNRFVYDRTNEILTLLGTDSGTIKLSDTSTGFVIIKAGPTVMSNANWIFPTNGMNGNHFGLLAATNTSGGTNAQMKLMTLGGGFTLSGDGNSLNTTVDGMTNLWVLELNGVATNLTTYSGSPSLTVVPLPGIGTNSFQIKNTNDAVITFQNSNDVFVTSNLYVKASISNESLAASTILSANAGKTVASVANAAGMLTNDGAGVFGWMTIPGGGGGLTTNANQFSGAPLSIKNNALVTNLMDFNTLTVTSTTPAFDLANANNTFRQIVNDTVWKLFNTVPNTSGELQYGTNGLLQMLARVVNTNTAFQIVDDYSTNTLLAVTTNGLLWLRGAITLTNRPGDGTPWLRINETNGRGYTEFTVTNSLATNRLVWWLGSNTVAASQVLKVHSTAISGGINTIVLTNDTDTAGTGTNSVVQTNGTTVGSIGTLNFVPGQNTTVTGMVNGSVVTLAVNTTAGGGDVHGPPDSATGELAVFLDTQGDWITNIATSVASGGVGFMSIGGKGVNDEMRMVAGGTVKWRLMPNGNLLPSPYPGYDIGTNKNPVNAVWLEREMWNRAHMQTTNSGLINTNLLDFSTNHWVSFTNQMITNLMLVITNTATLSGEDSAAYMRVFLYGANGSVIASNYTVTLQFQTNGLDPSPQFITWLTPTNGSFDFAVSSNKNGLLELWSDRTTNVWASYTEYGGFYQTNSKALGGARIANFVSGVTGTVVGATAVLGVDLNVTNVLQPATLNLTNWSNIPTSAMASAVAADFLTNWANAISNLTILSATNQVWVDKTGNDTTGTRNRFDKPFQTISNAIAAAVAGDVVNVGVGYFTNMTLQLKTNMTLHGVGDLTVIVGTNLYTAGSLIVPKDNCIIENLRLEAPTNYTFVNMIGISSTLTDSGEVGFTNLLVQNVSYNCEEDFYHVVHTNLTHAIFDNLRGKSKWDHFAVGSAGVTTNNHFFSVRNSTLVTGPEMSVENTGAQRAVWLNGGARGEFVNCEIVVTNGDGTSPAHAIEIYTNGLPEVSKLDLINTRIRSAGIAGSFTIANTNGTVSITGRLIPTNTIFGAFTQTPGIVENLTAGANITLTPNDSSGYTIAASGTGGGITPPLTNDGVYLRPIGDAWSNAFLISTQYQTIRLGIHSLTNYQAQPELGAAFVRYHSLAEGDTNWGGYQLKMYDTNQGNAIHNGVILQGFTNNTAWQGTWILEHGNYASNAMWSFIQMQVGTNLANFVMSIHDQPSCVSMLPATIGQPYRFDTYTNAAMVQAKHTTWAYKGGAALGVGLDLMILETNGQLRPFFVHPRSMNASKLVRTDSVTNLADVTIGTGLSFDGTTLSATASGGATIGVGTNGAIVATNTAVLLFTNSPNIRPAGISNDVNLAEIRFDFLNGTTGGGAVVLSNAPIANNVTLLGTTISSTLNNSGTVTGATVQATTFTGNQLNVTNIDMNGSLSGGAITLTNQLTLVRVDLKSIVANKTNLLDFNLGPMVVLTNNLATNSIFILTNTDVGKSMSVYLYGSGILGGTTTNAWQVTFQAQASGTNIVWPIGSTNGNYDILVNSNQYVLVQFPPIPRLTNIWASYDIKQ